MKVLGFGFGALADVFCFRCLCDTNPLDQVIEAYKLCIRCAALHGPISKEPLTFWTLAQKEEWFRAATKSQTSSANRSKLDPIPTVSKP